MTKPTVRNAQLISPFGVGSLCEVDGQSLFIRGTGSWETGRNLEKIARASLTERLTPTTLMRPRESVAVTRFPRWHFCAECREMTFWSYEKDKKKQDDGSLPRPLCSNAACKRARLAPMRFIAVCDNGHLEEIDWYWWAHKAHQQAVNGPCDRKTAKLKFEVSGKSGGDFSSMHIACSCGSSGSLEGIADGPLPQKCKGKQPGERDAGCIGKGEGSEPAKLYLEPRGSSALHYASVISALDITGETESAAWAKLRENEVYRNLLGVAKNLVEIGQTGLLETVAKQNVVTIATGMGLDGENAWTCFLDDVIGAASVPETGPAPEFTQETILSEEFPVLAHPTGQESKWLVTRPAVPGPRHGLDKLFERVVRVERLREVRAFRGFQRRNVTTEQATISPSLGRTRTGWLPSIQVLGEGVFLEFSKDAIRRWLDANGDEILDFTRGHLANAEKLGLPGRMGFNATPAFIMVHTFSHLLINQLSFDCGYSSTSLRERVYCGPNSDPYAGILVYTADSDAEGSMGGLSEMGSPGRIEDVVYRAVARSQWCSSDPVCRELDAQGIDGLNRAACHACSLVAETSCTFSNVLLDRVLVAGDGRVNGRGAREPVGFFRDVASI